jgi:hypothetical protein
MKSLVLTIIASFTLLIGLISMLTPIPGGIFIVAFSLTSLTCTSPRARSIILYMREKNNFINKIFFILEDKVGSRITIIGDALKQTQPNTRIEQG